MLYSLTRVPQLGQNTVSALILAWQLGQTTASGSATSALVPQAGQNEAPCGRCLNLSRGSGFILHSLLLDLLHTTPLFGDLIL